MYQITRYITKLMLARSKKISFPSMITNSDTSKHPPKKFANGNVWRRLNTKLLWFIAASYNELCICQSYISWKVFNAQIDVTITRIFSIFWVIYILIQDSTHNLFVLPWNQDSMSWNHIGLKADLEAMT